MLIFLALALPLGLLMARMVPLGQVADEPAHVLKADSLLHGEWIGRRSFREGADGKLQLSEGVDGDRALLAAIVSIPHPLDMTPTRMDPVALAASKKVPFGQASFSETGTIASYFPVFYLPAAGAIGFCKILGLTAYDGFLAARLCNLLVSIALAAASLALARRGRSLLFVALLLPLSISLMASINQDGLLIATACLAAALATRLEADTVPSRSPAFLGAAVLIGGICIAKPPYLPLVTMLLLPLRRGWTGPLPSGVGARLTAISAITVAVFGWTWLNVHYAAAPIARNPAEAGPLWTGPRPAIFSGIDMSAQLRVLLAKPWRMIWLPLHTMVVRPDIFRQIVGVLGWLNLMLPDWLMALWTLALGCGLLGCTGCGQTETGNRAVFFEAILLIGTTLVTILLIYLSQYLSFTPVGWNWISGPQGRYLIPLLPLLALAMPAWRGKACLPDWIAALPAIFAALAGFWVIPACITAFYYTGSP